jgi:hypothetical protein
MQQTLTNGLSALKAKAHWLAALGFVSALALFSGVAAAAAGYSLFGDAQIVSPGNASPHAVQIRSDADPGFGGIRYDVPTGTTFADLDQLATDFMPESDDLCVGGSPRFQLGIDTDGDGDRDASIFAYFGPDSASPACVSGVWQNTTDLLDPAKLLDTSQLAAGTFYDPYPSALAKYGSLGVTSISVVVDASWAHADSEQTFLVDNTNVDGTVYTYDQPANKDECKKGGWMSLTRADGSSFKNQGDCIQYANTGR